LIKANFSPDPETPLSGAKKENVNPEREMKIAADALDET
jgi:hypothetical protein